MPLKALALAAEHAIDLVCPFATTATGMYTHVPLVLICLRSNAGNLQLLQIHCQHRAKTSQQPALELSAAVMPQPR
jgi:hypothetical protein